MGRKANALRDNGGPESVGQESSGGAGANRNNSHRGELPGNKARPWKCDVENGNNRGLGYRKSWTISIFLTALGVFQT